MSERPFDPMNEPEQCVFCHDFPDWLEIASEVYQCQNCYAIFNSKGVCVEEPPVEEDDEDA